MRSPVVMICMRGAGALALLLAFSCAPGPNPDPARDVLPNWPYPSLTRLARGPADVMSFPDGLSGRWLEHDPFANRVLLESRDPRYFAGYGPGGLNQGWYDMGVGVRIESLVPVREGEWLVAARYYGTWDDGGPVTARALLEVDLSPPLILGSMPLALDRDCRGLAFDERKNRVFMVQASEDGTGYLQLMDLYRGRVTRRLPLGAVPFGIERRALAYSPDHLEVAVLVGGDPGVSDFAPRDLDAAEEEAPRLLVVSSETFEAVERIALPKGFEPRTVVYNPDRGELVVLVSQVDRTLVLTVDLDFHSVEQIVELSGAGHDLAVSGDVAVVPTDRGLFYVDLALGGWEVVTLFETDRTGELALSADGRTAWLRVFEFRGMEQPGLVEFDLVSRTASEVRP